MRLLRPDHLANARAGYCTPCLRAAARMAQLMRGRGPRVPQPASWVAAARMLAVMIPLNAALLSRAHEALAVCVSLDPLLFARHHGPVASAYTLRCLLADSCTAGGRVRRKRGFRSYVAATLALPADAVAGLTAVGSSLAVPEAAGLGMG